MEPSGSTFVFELVNFLLLVAALSWLLFRPVRAFIEARERALRERSDELAMRRKAMDLELARVEQLRAQSEAMLESQRARMDAEASAARTRLASELRDRSEEERAHMARELEAERRSLAQEWSKHVAKWTALLTERLLEQIRGPDLTRALVSRACLEIAALREAAVIVDPVLELAAPLDDEQLELLAHAVGVTRAGLRLREVPELVAGVRMVSSAGAIDASVRGLADHVARSLQAAAIEPTRRSVES